MTNNPTIDGVSRELLEQSDTFLEAHSSGPSIESNLAADLRALLDADIPASVAPANELREHCKQRAEVVKTWPEWKQNCLGGAPAVERQEPAAFRFKWDYDHGNGWCRGAVRFVESMEEADHEDKSTWREITPLYEAAPDVAALQSTIAQLQARIGELESGRSEPFGYVDQPYAKWMENKTSGWTTIWATDGSNNPARGKPSVALFTAPPAPVAVVLPDRWVYQYFGPNPSPPGGYVDGWNACLDATAALNGERK